MRRTSPRPGFVLLAVLWLIVGLGALALALQHRSRASLRAVARRAELERSQWLAEECIARSRLVIARVLAADSTSSRRSTTWRHLDSAVVNAALVRSCPGLVSMEADGTRLDVNAATGEQLRRLFTRVVGSAAAADSLADAVLDWRDADDIARPAGAERDWYVANGRFLPRNGSFADLRELARVRGLERVRDVDALLDVDTGPVGLSIAPLVVLASLPGFDDEALDAIADLRSRGGTFDDPLEIAGYLSHDSRDSLEARRHDIAELSTADPGAWTLRATGNAGDRSAETTVELRLVPAASGVHVARRRVWP